MNAVSKIEPATLAASMAAAFAEIGAAIKAKENAAFKNGGKVSKYADIGSVIDAIKPALVSHGLFFTQSPKPADGAVLVETMLHHSGGEVISLGTVSVPVNKNDAQAYGSALTYARRYGLVTAFGVPTEDDDGNAAVAGGQGKREVSPPSPEQPKNWGGRYPTKTALWAACRSHHAELERLAMESTLSDLEDFLTSPEYSDYLAIATVQFPWMLEGPAPESMPEFIPSFRLEAKARDLIALRGNVPADAEETN